MAGDLRPGKGCSIPLSGDVPEVLHDGLGPPGPPDRPEDGSALGAILPGFGSEVKDLLDRNECGVIVRSSDLGEAYELGDILGVVVPMEDAVRAPEGEVGPAHVAIVIIGCVAIIFLLAVSVA